MGGCYDFEDRAVYMLWERLSTCNGIEKKLCSARCADKESASMQGVQADSKTSKPDP